MLNNNEGLKVAFVTGSTRGIGLITAIQLAKAGYMVVTNSRKKLDLLSPAFVKYIDSHIRMDYIAGDVTKEDDVTRIFSIIKKKYGRIDILVNNAGNSERKAFIRLSQQDMMAIVNNNLLGAMICSKIAIYYMIQQRYGRIINISSIAGLHGMPFEVHYSAAKAGLSGMVKAIAKEYGAKGITCNAVAPGIMNKQDKIHQNEEEIIKQIAVKRKGELREVAELVAFLASDKSAYITGQTIRIDGGLYL